ncbi:MAG: histidinol-phosphate transaminase [Tissierellia bacterium]|nr:histidinol-phosphate transaminase [Tissierellia bacterium]
MTREYLKEALKDYVCYQASKVTEKTFLHANENPSNLLEDPFFKEGILQIIEEMAINRYPDPSSWEIRCALAKYLGVKREEIIVGNGADEMITLISSVYLEPGDVVVTHSPSFEMYGLSAKLQNAVEIAVPDVDGKIDVEGMIRAANEHRAKLLYLCTPNNPTGFLLSEESVRRVIDETDALIILDEAYLEFTGKRIRPFLLEDRVIVLRTLSKAFGLAGLRVGYAAAQEPLINELNFARAPFNLNQFSQQVGAFLVEHADRQLEQVQGIIDERERMYQELKDKMGVTLWPSEGNFLLLRIDPSRYEALLDSFAAASIRVKAYGNRPQLENCIRLTIGSPSENDRALACFEEGKDA